MDERGDGRGAFHRVGQPDKQRNLRGLPRRADKEQQRDNRHGAERGFRTERGDASRHILEVERAEPREDQQHAEDESPVADAVDNEGFLAGIGRGLFLIPEADQQVRTEPDAFPPDEHHEEVRAQHEHEHERREQVQVGEVPRVLGVGLLVHVRRRIHVDQQPDAGDHENHHGRERVQPQREGDREIARADPGERALDDGAALWRERHEPGHCRHRHRKRQHHRTARDHARRRLAETTAEAGVQQEPDERQERNQ